MPIVRKYDILHFFNLIEIHTGQQIVNGEEMSQRSLEVWWAFQRQRAISCIYTLFLTYECEWMTDHRPSVSTRPFSNRFNEEGRPIRWAGRQCP